MIILETTLGCPQAPRVVFLLEELELAYQLELRDEGYFLAHHRRPGPLYREGQLELFEGSAILRHLGRSQGGGRLLPPAAAELAQLDSWLDFVVLRLGFPFAHFSNAQRSGATEAVLADARAPLERALEILDDALEGRDWLLDEFSLADAAHVGLVLVGKQFDLAPWPRVLAYAKRLAQRPAFGRTLERLSSLRPTAPAR